jgi:hypothetical protein
MMISEEENELVPTGQAAAQAAPQTLQIVPQALSAPPAGQQILQNQQILPQDAAAGATFIGGNTAGAEARETPTATTAARARAKAGDATVAVCRG